MYEFIADKKGSHFIGLQLYEKWSIILIGCIHTVKYERGVAEEPQGAPGAKIPAPFLYMAIPRCEQAVESTPDGWKGIVIFVIIWSRQEASVSDASASGTFRRSMGHRLVFFHNGYPGSPRLARFRLEKTAKTPQRFIREKPLKHPRDSLEKTRKT